MSSNVGLSTPRGSGTSGHVQRNLSLLKPRDAGVGAPYKLDSAARGPKTRKPDQEILNHDRLRDIEVKVLELREKLEDEEVDEDKIDVECDELREKLTADMARNNNKSGGGKRVDGKALKSYQVHEMAEAKERESERLRKALGLKPGEIREDGEHPMPGRKREDGREKNNSSKAVTRRRARSTSLLEIVNSTNACCGDTSREIDPETIPVTIMTGPVVHHLGTASAVP